jgi:diketogulonate reductase-like aldo/keto reductase
MPIPTKKLTNGFEIPIYGLGTWQMGGKRAKDPDNNDEADIRAIRTAIESGVTHIDTAESYAGGYTETLIGKAIRGYDRSKLFLVSKVAAHHLKYDDLITAARESLKRLQTTYLDLYLTHRPNPPEIPIKETFAALDALVREGIVRHIGVSNYSIPQMREAQSHTKNKIVTNQVHYNLQIREIEHKDVLSYCQQKDIILTAYRPLQKGMIINVPILEDMAKKYKKTPTQIALNWLISQKNVITISKTRSHKHLKENLGALDWKMNDEDLEKLRTGFPNQQTISDTVPLH